MPSPPRLTLGALSRRTTAVCGASRTSPAETPSTFRASPQIWLVLPLPADAKLISPGFDFASASSSFRFEACTDGCTTIMFGVDAALTIGAKSFSGE